MSCGGAAGGRFAALFFFALGFFAVAFAFDAFIAPRAGFLAGFFAAGFFAAAAFFAGFPAFFAFAFFCFGMEPDATRRPFVGKWPFATAALLMSVCLDSVRWLVAAAWA